jgi:hypothetical protein
MSEEKKEKKNNKQQAILYLEIAGCRFEELRKQRDTNSPIR